NAGSNSVTCTTPSVVLTNQSTTGIPPSTFSNSLPVVPQLWSGPIGIPNASSIVATAVGVYSLTVLDPNNGCTSVGTYSLREGRDYPVVNNPNSPPPYCLDPPTTTVDISPILGGAVANYTYQWQAPASATVSGQNTATNAVGTYTVIVTNTVSGCTTSSNLIVTVCTGLFAENLDENTLKIYPNPSSGKIYTEGLMQLQIQSIEIYNSEGRRIRSYDAISENLELTIENQAKGLYFIIFRNEQGQAYHAKFILE
nr:T9SS type A sorting domain-containing protein [Bacteroidia bacterium]